MRLNKIVPIIVLLLLLYQPVICPASELFGSGPIGMAGAFRAVADDNNAILYNPAGIATTQGYAVDMLYYSDVRAQVGYGMSAADT